MKPILLLIFIAGFLIFVTIEVKSTSDSVQNDHDMSYLLDCGYIRQNIANTIFHPNFILYLSRLQEKYKTLSKKHIVNAIAKWNANNIDKRKIIRFQQEHFNRLAMLSVTIDNCDDYECVINGEALAVLRYWMSDIVVDIEEYAAVQVVNLSELKSLNIDNDKDIATALEKIMGVTIGKQLIANAIDNNVTIRSKHLHNLKGYYDCQHKTIVVDPTVASYIFKINCIIHELVHACNQDSDNSITEETIAEMIGMEVQDKITNIDISCSPYIVFIDRLLDQQYGKYPVRNNIEKYLQQAGIVIKIANE